jgi:foldase protein PrsA
MPSPLIIIVKSIRGVLARRSSSLPALACTLLLITALAACGSSEQSRNSTEASSGSQRTASQGATSASAAAKKTVAAGAAIPSEAQLAAVGAPRPSSSAVPGASKVIASVRGQKITLGELLHRMGTMGPAKHEVPVPPDFSACVAHEASASTGKSPAQLKATCRSVYEELRRTALNLLIRARWLILETKALGLSVSETALARELAKGLKVAAKIGQTPASTGRTLADVKFWQRIDHLAYLLYEWVKRKTPPANAERVAAYYAQHKKDFALPERRDLHLIRTDTLASARRVLSELRAGKSFQRVVEELNVRQPIHTSKGSIKELRYTDYSEPRLSNAIFKARPHVLLGPVRLDASNAPPIAYGYFFFEVVKVHPPLQKSLAEVKDQLASSLPETLRVGLLTREVADFRRRWRARSDCRAGFVVEDCRQWARPQPGEDIYTF